MAKPKTTYKCTACDKTHTKWLGKCTCGEFNTLEEVVEAASTINVGTKSSGKSVESKPAQRINDVNAESHKHKSTGIGELDRVLGGGLVAGGVILLAGPPGTGKALALDTPIRTVNRGTIAFGNLVVGDKIYGDDKNPTEVVALSEIWNNRPCYEVIFSDGSRIIADEQHEWPTSTRAQRIAAEKSGKNPATSILTTKEISETLVLDSLNEDREDPNHSVDSKIEDNIRLTRYIVAVNPVESVPVRCIEVNNESHLFLVGENMIPTHNSSLLATVTNALASKENVLYVSGEESVQQIRIRHERMNAMGENLYLAAESDLAKVLWQIDEVDPKLIIIDSLQTIASADFEGRAGSMSQVTEVATILTRVAKSRNIPTIFVGHYTKDGNVAGPRVVEHLVDVVLAFEGEDDSPLRFLRGVKNRYGAADEVGCFEHNETGLEEVPDPSGMLLGSREESIPGIATSVYLEGKRAIPVEIQAVVLESPLPNPRKGTSGLDPTRSLMLQAILQKHSKHAVKLADKDVYVSTAGGLRIREPAVDLATVVALATDALNTPSRFDAVWIGEVSLSGEIRKVTGLARRVSEAMRLGFKIVYVPFGSKATLPPSILKATDFIVAEVKDLNQLINILRGMGSSIEINELK